MDNTELQNRPQYQEEETLDLKVIIIKILSYWYLFAIGIVVALILGFIYNRYTPSVYQTSASVFIKEDKMGIDPTSMMTGLTFKSNINIDNEIGILQSFSLKERTIKELEFFNVSYYVKGRVATRELYKETPFNVELDYDTAQVVGVNYQIEFIDNGQYRLKSKEGRKSVYDYNKDQNIGVKEVQDFEGVYKLGEWVNNGYNKFRIILNSNYNPDPEDDFVPKYSFTIRSRLSLISEMSSVSISQSTKNSSILNLSIQGNNINKITDYLNQLLHEYMERNLEQKNLVSENTVIFIDEQLIGIQDSLQKAETDLQIFQEGNDFMDLRAQSQEMFNRLKDIERRKAELELSIKYYQNLQDYINKNIDDLNKLVVPSAMGIQDQMLNKLVLELVALSSKKAEQLATSTEKNPIVQTIDEQIIQTKKQLLENITNMINNTNVTIEELTNQIMAYEEQIKQLPTTQRAYLGYERKFALNDELYKFLMQKRAEAQIVMASNSPDNSIIDEARVSRARKVAPRSMMIYLVCIVLGCGIPAAFIFLKEILNTKIIERSDVEKITKLPIIGQIPYTSPKASNSSSTFVIDSPKSPVSEAFRSIRTNIEYIVKGKDKCIFSVVADSPGIGKTYISINMASIYAMYGKKTALIGMDLRKPRLYQEFGISNKIGISSYLAGKASIDEIIQPSGKLPTLDIVTAGPIPPNPAELIASDRCSELFKELKERYDYIIVDTPPLLWVTDALLLMKHVDTSIFVVRQDVTNKKAFEVVIKDLEQRNYSTSIVVNGINYQGIYGYRYSYGYGGYGYGYGYGRNYGYSYGYYDEEHENGRKRRK
ncbi:MAG: polysaccharide biosynthesis tyrosine autokinase [Lentimicrobiaceae bacterium]|nr:polysaccharide biosynthesis tyrosine autokinase [Lentimicrobiaceae bacterium]